ncbi:MAG: Phage-related baseplate assembly protein [candidate division BRC1 bacterium ADurb.BinA292]|nr:MAG: Phage-related baseplate assembly protein [candidate division BRC1 bacterium ADurb.BinA292]
MATQQEEQHWLYSDVSDYSFRAGDLDIQELRVIRFELHEAISELFHVRIELASLNQELAIDELVGRPGVLRLSHFNQEHERWVNGIVKLLDYTSSGSQYCRYEAQLVPRVWLLGLRRQSRIFQDMTVPDIIKQVLTDAGIPADMFRMALTGNYGQRGYCVQYRETDLDFIKRLAEEEGIFFFFEHTEETHVMVFGDAPSVHKPIAGKPEVPFRTPTDMVEGKAFVSQFRYGQQVRTGSAMLRDFNFENPKQNLDAEKDSGKDTALEFYDYPGEYKVKSEGETYVNVRLQEFRTFLKVARATSVERRLQPGYRFNLIEHPRQDLNAEYLVTRVRHRGCHLPAVVQESGGVEVDEPTYQNEILAIPFSTPYRPPRVTPKPVVEGSQTAIVTGPSGEEIYTDQYGRVKVKFHWDREGQHNEKSSCWIRVSQNWAGGKYGIMFLPRIGHEVIVDFLEGDPDQPIITGRVYNNDEMPPYELPAHKTRSTIKSASSKDQEGSNEIRFEDLAGSEQIFIHAQKDLHVRVLNERRVNIGADSHETVGANFNMHVEKDRSRKVKGKENIEVVEDKCEKIGGNLSEEIGGSHKEKVGGTFQVDANKIILNATQEVVIKGPGGFVVINGGGTYVKGNMVYINSGGAAVTEGPGTIIAPTAPAAADEAQYGEDTSYTAEKRPQKKIPKDKLEKKSWIEIRLVDAKGKPVPGEAYELETSDGKTLVGTLDGKGRVRIEGIEPGTCMVCFPNRAPDEWQRV